MSDSLLKLPQKTVPPTLPAKPMPPISTISSTVIKEMEGNKIRKPIASGKTKVHLQKTKAKGSPRNSKPIIVKDAKSLQTMKREEFIKELQTRLGWFGLRLLILSLIFGLFLGLYEILPSFEIIDTILGLLVVITSCLVGILLVAAFFKVYIPLLWALSSRLDDIGWKGTFIVTTTVAISIIISVFARVTKSEGVYAISSVIWLWNIILWLLAIFLPTKKESNTTEQS